MAINLINVGTTSNDGTGDPLRTAFLKANGMFTELYNAVDIPTGNIRLVEKWYYDGVLNSEQGVIEAGDLCRGRVSDTEYGILLQYLGGGDDQLISNYNIIQSSEIPMLEP